MELLFLKQNEYVKIKQKIKLSQYFIRQNSADKLHTFCTLIKLKIFQRKLHKNAY